MMASRTRGDLCLPRNTRLTVDRWTPIRFAMRVMEPGSVRRTLAAVLGMLPFRLNFRFIIIYTGRATVAFVVDVDYLKYYALVKP